VEREDLPRLIAQAIDDLLAQREGSGPLTSDDAAWGWALEDVAKEFPGATARWKGSAITLALPGRELALTPSEDDLDVILTELARLEAARDTHAIVSKRFNAVWSSAAECAKYLEAWRRALLGALA